MNIKYLEPEGSESGMLRSVGYLHLGLGTIEDGLHLEEIIHDDALLA